MDTLLVLFQDVMSEPESMRGLNVAETCRLLAARARGLGGDYQGQLQALEDLYLDQFAHTCTMRPEFPATVRREMASHR